MDSKLLISCKNLGYYSQSDSFLSPFVKWDVRDLTLELFGGDRVCFHFDNKDQKQVLLRLFLQKLKPKKGSFMLSSKIHIYYDYNLWEGTNKKASLDENLKSKLFSTRPWFGGKRKNIENLIDRLDLGGQIRHVQVQKLSLEQKIRLRLLMIIAAKTKVILIDNLFSQLDEHSFLLFQEWLEKFSGILIFFGDYFRDANNRKNFQVGRQEMDKTLFNTIISFTSDGFSKTLILKKSDP